jgi:predicted nucleic acid-binding protein
MVFLIDTNVWLERLLDQEKSKEVGELFDTIPSERLFITDFAFHSIALVLSKLNNVEALRHFIRDTFVEGAVTLLHLKPEDMERLILVMRDFDLDFDDAYQYVAAEKTDSIIVSLDKDFDQTERGRKTPREVLQGQRR